MIQNLCVKGGYILFNVSKIFIKSAKAILLAVGTVVDCATTPATGAGSNALLSISVVNFSCQAIFWYLVTEVGTYASVLLPRKYYL